MTCPLLEECISYSCFKLISSARLKFLQQTTSIIHLMELSRNNSRKMMRNKIKINILKQKKNKVTQVKIPWIFQDFAVSLSNSPDFPRFFLTFSNYCPFFKVFRISLTTMNPAIQFTTRKHLVPISLKVFIWNTKFSVFYICTLSHLSL